MNGFELLLGSRMGRQRTMELLPPEAHWLRQVRKRLQTAMRTGKEVRLLGDVGGHVWGKGKWDLSLLKWLKVDCFEEEISCSWQGGVAEKYQNM